MSDINKKLNDVLQHYGVKGMKWDIHRDPEEIQKDLAAGVNAAGEALEDASYTLTGRKRSVTKELGDVVNVLFGGKGNLAKEGRDLNKAVKGKFEDISKDVKKRGYNMLLNLFGPAKKTKTIEVSIESPRRK